MNDSIVKSFDELVELNFHLYNNLFLTLPMDAVIRTGRLLPILRDDCEKGLDEGKDPISIISGFLDKNSPELSPRQRIDFLFHVIQYVERQILLIDALEDAAYNKIHRIDGPNSLQQLLQRVKEDHLQWKLNHILSFFAIRVVLTAHPTQFYPGQILAISSDLTKAIASKETSNVRNLMHQLSKTPFFRKQKPTPYNEALRLEWYLSNIFYHAVGDLLEMFNESQSEHLNHNEQLISLGFWPGGDRDGNPFVNSYTTLKVAELLRSSIITCYLDDLKKLKRRLTFVGVSDKLESIEEHLKDELNSAGSELPTNELVDQLMEIERTIIEKHQSLFINKVQILRKKVSLFGYHFASLDIRQDSRIIAKAVNDILKRYGAAVTLNQKSENDNSGVDELLNTSIRISDEDWSDDLTADTINSIKAMREIQSSNGELGSNRYIISNCRGALDVAGVLSIFRMTGWENPTVDIVPLFETIDDLAHAGDSMRLLYSNAGYMNHLLNRKKQQTVMLGFSDGTKDGGYLTANWSIFLAKEQITAISRQAGIEVIFFDGRGGPPARGGGNAHLFYSALGSKVESKQIQLTLQGQTISSHYGLRESAVHNLGYLLAAGLANNLFNQTEKDISDTDRELMNRMSESGFRKYNNFKNHPLFVPFLEERSTLKYYGMANISSRPSKRGDSGKLVFDDLRAIPFVGAWSQLKQNVPGFFGLGTALKEQEELGNLQQCVEFYNRSSFFRALISNSMQSISKSNLALTKYMEKDEKFGDFWKIIYDEFQITREMLLKVAKMVVMLEDNPRSRKSIKLRENIVLPLLVIQQYALMKTQENDDPHSEIYEKLIMRSLFGNINATRNAV
jgi:phosphoenolpyruvate carboxylase